jgi:hypothetical protein
MPVHDMPIKDTFTLVHKLNLKDSPTSDFLTLISSNWIVSVEKASDGEAVFIILIDGARRSKKLKRETVLA